MSFVPPGEDLIHRRRSNPTIIPQCANAADRITRAAAPIAFDRYETCDGNIASDEDDVLASFDQRDEL